MPDFTYEFILEAAGVVLEEPTEEGGNAGSSSGRAKSTVPAKSSGSNRGETRGGGGGGTLSNLTLDELNQKLSEVLGNEDYEQAARIRDEIKRRSE